MDDSASISVSTKDVSTSLCPNWVMRFMAGKNPRQNYGRTRPAIASLAQERLRILLEQARDTARRDATLSKRYVQLARKISMRTKIRIPKMEKQYLCKSCGIALIPGLNARVRLSPGNNRIVLTCIPCGAVKRYPYVRKRPENQTRPQ